MAPNQKGCLVLQQTTILGPLGTEHLPRSITHLQFDPNNEENNGLGYIDSLGILRVGNFTKESSDIEIKNAYYLINYKNESKDFKVLESQENRRIITDFQFIIKRPNEILFKEKNRNQILFSKLKNNEIIPIYLFGQHNSIIVDYAVSEDGEYLISNSKDGNVKLYEISNGSLLNQIKDAKFLNLNCIKMKNKNTILMGYEDGNCEVWQITNKPNKLEIKNKLIKLKNGINDIILASEDITTTILKHSNNEAIIIKDEISIDEYELEIYEIISNEFRKLTTCIMIPIEPIGLKIKLISDKYLISVIAKRGYPSIYRLILDKCKKSCSIDITREISNEEIEEPRNSSNIFVFKGITKDELKNKKLSSKKKELPRLPCNFPPMSIKYSKEINDKFQISKNNLKANIFKDLPEIKNEINPNKEKLIGKQLDKNWVNKKNQFKPKINDLWNPDDYLYEITDSNVIDCPYEFNPDSLSNSSLSYLF